jgi:uncharacterized protein (DUF2235 family)
MPKRIAFCADGTWDDANKHTNVYKIYKAMAVMADQIPFYDDGVGATPNPVWKFVGGAFGTGIWQKVADAYAKIAHVYEKDDEVFLFGFSRGAYTARSVAGMIAACGLPTSNFSDDLVKTAFRAYRDKDERQKILATLANRNMYAAKIKMVGVWDTVGSLGIPSVVGVVDPVAYGFLDTGLSPMIENAYHALAVDEKRAEFPATLWTSAPAPGQKLEQVWFTGVHSDVGGGEPEDPSGATSLSDITLAWMMSKASALGLQFDPAALKQYIVPLDPKYALDTLHGSWNVLWGFPRRRAIAANSVLANTVRIRSQHDSTYRPENLAFENGVLGMAYGIDGVANEPEIAIAAGG